MITKRDSEILDFIELLGAASLSQIKRRFMDSKNQGEVIARRRMKRLYDMKMVKRERSFINTEYIYYQKNTLLEHKLTLTEFNVRLQELPGKILEFDVEKNLGDIRPDACCDYLFSNRVYQFCIEVHLSTIPFDQPKYEMFYESGKYRQWYKIFPRIIVVTDRNVIIKPSKLKYILLPASCLGIERILA